MSTPATPVALTGSDQAVCAKGSGRYMGVALRETAGAAAVVRIYDNASAASGTLLDAIDLAANASADPWYGPGGIWFANGVYVKIVSGAVEGSVRVG